MMRRLHIAANHPDMRSSVTSKLTEDVEVYPKTSCSHNILLNLLPMYILLFLYSDALISVFGSSLVLLLLFVHPYDEEGDYNANHTCANSNKVS